MMRDNDMFLYNKYLYNYIHNFFFTEGVYVCVLFGNVHLKTSNQCISASLQTYRFETLYVCAQ